MVDSIAYGGLGYARQGRHYLPRFDALNYTLGDTLGGGQPLTITGAALQDARVKLGGVECTVLSTTPTSCVFELPPASLNTVSLQIITPGGTISVPSAFEYWNPNNSFANDFLDSNVNVLQAPGGSINVLDSYDSSNLDSSRSLSGALGAITETGQSFSGNGEYVVRSSFLIKKTGSPTGNITSKLYAAVFAEFGAGNTPGTLLATSDPINVATLTTGYATTEFTFSGAQRVAVTAGTRYFIVISYSGGDSSNTLDVGRDASTPTHSGYEVIYQGSWSKQAGSDVIFSVSTQAGVGPVVSWADRAYGDTYSQATSVKQPSRVLNVFGSMPAIRFSGTQYLTGIYQNMFGAGGEGGGASGGMTVFTVAAWTSSDATAAQVRNAPLTIIGDVTNGASAFGARADLLMEVHNTGTNTNAGASLLNDGVARLIGISLDTTTNIKFFVGSTQQGATIASVATTASAWDTIGAGYTGVDGFVGDLAAVIVYYGPITVAELSKLYRWARQRYGVS